MLPEPDIIAPTLSSTLSLVKYKLSPSVISVVVSASLTVIVPAASSYVAEMLPLPVIIPPTAS